jgi:hypothetical protein
MRPSTIRRRIVSFDFRPGPDGRPQVSTSFTCAPPETCILPSIGEP